VEYFPVTREMVQYYCDLCCTYTCNLYRYPIQNYYHRILIQISYTYNIIYTTVTITEYKHIYRYNNYIFCIKLFCDTLFILIIYQLILIASYKLAYSISWVGKYCNLWRNFFFLHDKNKNTTSNTNWIRRYYMISNE